MCVQCHTDFGERPERHTRHAANTEASRCVSCHMPRIMEAVLFQARSHEIDDIPDAEMTERFGTRRQPECVLDLPHRARRRLAAQQPGGVQTREVTGALIFSSEAPRSRIHRRGPSH